MAHGQRVMMKIFRLTQGTNTLVSSDFPSSQNLQGKYLEDIDGNGRLLITPENTPGVTWDISWAPASSVYVPVETNLDGSRFIMVRDDMFNLQRFDVQHREVASSAASVGINVLPTAFSGAGGTLLVGNPLPTEFTFYINPQHVNLVASKRLTEMLTRGGYEVQHWGNALTEIQVTGKTGALYKTSTGGIPDANGTIDITQSLAWKRLSQLRDLYDADQAVKNQGSPVLSGMNYYDRFYTGYFTSFTGPEADAASPYQVDFNFSFKVQREQPITRG